jgi:hypothetical protein
MAKQLYEEVLAERPHNTLLPKRLVRGAGLDGGTRDHHHHHHHCQQHLSAPTSTALHPPQSTTQSTQAALHRSCGDLPQAIDVLRVYLQHYSNDQTGWEELADCYLEVAERGGVSWLLVC